MPVGAAMCSPALGLPGSRRRPRLLPAPLGAALRGAATSLALVAALPAQAAPPPSELFGELFTRVQLERVFQDGKTFVDAVPKRPPEAILADYRAAPPTDRAALARFVTANFTVPADKVEGPAKATCGLAAHIAGVWPLLIRGPETPPPFASALPMTEPHVVPGGRFREIYYWDSYFTMLGLVRDGHEPVAHSMVRAFEGALASYGRVPNGMRTYYLSRSQPPVFHMMVGLMNAEPAKAYAAHIPALKAEHAFWMAGADGLKPGEARGRVVALDGGAVLNRYWDDRDTPRDESYREDVETAKAAGRPATEVYRDLRAGAESGWDYSSRWFADGRSLATIETTSIIPVDLNSLLYGLEQAIAGGCREAADRDCAETFAALAQRRRAAMNRFLWDPGGGRYLDYHWGRGARIPRPSAAMLYPLFVRAADADQARKVAATVRADLLAPGGLATTTVSTGQQWDKPNGWAPLQWIGVVGLRNYGHDELAETIGRRWIGTVERRFRASGKLVEKYDVDRPGAPGGGGEYPLQDGFGWTNGVTRALLDLYPQPADRAPACPPAEPAPARP